MAQTDSKAKLPNVATQWVRYLLGFSVSIGVGLAPYLGKVNVPLFTPMLSFIPLFLQDTVIPLSSAVMGIVAVWVQWNGSTRVSKSWASRMFTRILLTAIVSLLALVVVEMLAVERIHINANGETVSYAVGFSYPTWDVCKGLSRADCIETQLTLNPAKIATYFGPQQVRLTELLLVLSYTVFMSSFGALVGVLVITRRVRARKNDPKS